MPENIATQQYDNLRDRNVELVLGRLAGDDERTGFGRGDIV